MQFNLANISSIEYSSVSHRITFFTRLNGYELPISVVKKDLGDNPHISSNLVFFMTTYNITKEDIHNGFVLH